MSRLPQEIWNTIFDFTLELFLHDRQELHNLQMRIDHLPQELYDIIRASTIVSLPPQDTQVCVTPDWKPPSCLYINREFVSTLCPR